MRPAAATGRFTLYVPLSPFSQPTTKNCQFLIRELEFFIHEIHTGRS